MQKPTLRIPTKTLTSVSPESYVQKRTQTRHNYPEHIAKEASLKKYAPKYCYSLCLNSTFHRRKSLLSKIKHLKILHHFEYNFGYDSHRRTYITKLLKSLLRTNRKSLKSLPIIASEHRNSDIHPIPLLEICSYFPNVQLLKASLSCPLIPKPNHDFVSKALEKEILRSYGYFWGSLKHVQHLEISTLSPNIWLILPKVQASERFLASLKTFHLKICLYSRNDQKNYPRILFQTLLKNQNLFKYITHLNFSPFENFHLYGFQIKSLLDSCTSLVSLSFPISTNFHKNSLTLAPLQSQSFQKVTKLTLQVDDVWSVIEAFTFPPLLKDLTLHLRYRSSWSQIWSILYPIGFAHQDTKKYKKIFRDFFKKFQQLSRLNSLDMKMPRFTHPKEIINNFILPLLQAIPKLENFECQFCHEYKTLETPFDLSTFLDGISLLPSLKSFKIRHPHDVLNDIMKDDLPITFNPSKAYQFPNITSVYLSAWILEDFDFKHFFKMLSNNDCLEEIHLERIFLTSVQAFLRLLKLLKEVGELNPLWKIQLGITLSVKNLADIVGNIRYPIIPERNVTIDLDIYVSSQKRFSLSQKGFRYMQSVFSYIKFDFSLLVPELSQHYPYREEKREIPLIRKNLPFSDSYHYI